MDKVLYKNKIIILVVRILFHTKNTIGIHIIALILYFPKNQPKSEFIASSVIPKWGCSKVTK